ncbi:MAG: response regulator transcription factor [Anaerolineae bacterium]
MTENIHQADPIRILIADDHAVVRRGLRTIISTEPGMEVVGEAVDGIEAVLQARALQPDVILLDLVMPRQDGIEALGEIKRENPDARVLVLTSFAQDDKLLPTVKAGALGYLLKDSSPDELLQAIRDVHQGKPSLHPAVANRLMRELNRSSQPPPAKESLTEREVQVLRLVAQGLVNREIAEKLVISEWTVRTHVRNILAKLHLTNRTQATLYALREGLVDL